jgi:23S rRNA pseudouridine1911/1915/1917 synthase
MSSNGIRILHIPTSEDPFVIIYKPHGMPSAPLFSDDNNNAFCRTAALFPELCRVRGKKTIEHGLLHRLDNDACGLLAIASTQQSYDALCESQKNGSFYKVYNVTCIQNEKNAKALGGFPPFSDFVHIVTGEKIIAESAFRPFGEGHRQVRPVTAKSGTAAERKSGTVIYRTEIDIVNVEKTIVKAQCRITAGYRHQVRCHLAWMGLPVFGDRLYNFQCNNERMLHFEGSILCFPHPLTGKKLVFTTSDEKI